jgi:protoporphyrinogen oxidase
MTLAWWLRDRGHDVTLLEGSAQLGGLAAPWKLGDIVWDRHYHVILNSDTHLLALLHRLGLSEEMGWVETRTGVASGGKVYSVSNTLEYLRFPPLAMTDKLRIAWTILYGSRIENWRRLEAIPVETWLRRHSGDRAFERFWLPLLRSKLGENYLDTSAAFIWATIQRLYAARRSGLKRELFGYVRGGYARIIDTFAATLTAAGVEIRTEARVAEVRWNSSEIVVDTDTDRLTFDRVVLTTPAPVTARLLPSLTDAEIQTLRKVEYQGIICASLLASDGLGGFYLTNITDSSPFTGVIEMSALVDRAELGGHHLIYLPRYASADDAVLTMTDDEIEASFIGAVTELFPHFDRSSVQAFRVSRQPHVFPVPRVGYSARVPPMETSIPGVFVVNSAQILNGTLNVNETLQLATRAMPILAGEVGYELSLLERPVTPLVPA